MLDHETFGIYMESKTPRIYIKKVQDFAIKNFFSFPFCVYRVV